MSDRPTPSEPAWVQNPDGSMLVMVPNTANEASANASTRKGVDNNTFPKQFQSDAIEDMPYYDYELPPLPEVPIFPQPFGAQGSTPAGAAVASVGRSADDEAFVQQCRQRDTALAAAVAAGDAPLAAAIAQADKHRPHQGGGNPTRGPPPKH